MKLNIYLNNLKVEMFYTQVRELVILTTCLQVLPALCWRRS